jgi:hypothetical protein
MCHTIPIFSNQNVFGTPKVSKKKKRKKTTSRFGSENREQEKDATIAEEPNAGQVAIKKTVFPRLVIKDFTINQQKFCRSMCTSTDDSGSVGKHQLDVPPRLPSPQICQTTTFDHPATRDSADESGPKEAAAAQRQQAGKMVNKCPQIPGESALQR